MSNFEIKLKELEDEINNYQNPEEQIVIFNEVEEDGI